jgi:15-cis-phytoene synthase
MTPEQYCQNKTAESGSSFYYSFKFLSHDRRRAITALYAFCREVDDVVDECTNESVARTTLAWWRGQVADIYNGKPQHPVAMELANVIKQFPLPQEHLLEIIDGMEMDLDQHQYADFKSLQLYCYRVASVVGLLAAEIFGYTDRKTLNVGEDARRGRIYLPQDEMAQFGVHTNDILDMRETAAFQKLMQCQIDRAQHYYDQALAELPTADRKAQRTGLIMAAIYRATLEEVVFTGCHVLRERVSLPPLRKLWIALSTWLKN